MFRLLVSAAFLNLAAPTVAAPLDFNREVRPILSDRCFHCHGPDSAARKADLRLDNPTDAAVAIEPGKPDASELVARIFSHDPDEQMPPPELKRPLSKKEKEILRRWVEEGAHYDQHWSFKPLSEPAIPAVVKKDWPRNKIDRFVLARLESEKLSPTTTASRERLIRRLAFDLTGLPPTPEEIEAFVADKQPDAYERLVDDYLARPEFGERMATPWLDLARYSDTYGFQVDRDRFVWPWRDWVIRVINDNLPYDKFITWQLAGDLLPDATRDQVLATTFNRLHPQKVEGGSDPEEFRVEYVADRVHTFGTAFLGLTLECSRCHDHKYDPIEQKDYYQFFSYFQNIDEAGLYSYFTPSIPTPTLALPTPEEEKKIAKLARTVADAEASYTKARQLALVKTSLAGHGKKTAPSQGSAVEKSGSYEWKNIVARFDFDEFADPATEDTKAKKEKKKAKKGQLVSSVGETTATTDPAANPLVDGKNGMAITLNGDEEVNLKVGNFERYDPFSIALWMWTPDHKDRAVVFHRSRAWTDAASRGYQLLLEDGKLSASLIHFWPGNALRVRALTPLPVEEWHHVTVTYDGSSRAEGLRLFVDGNEIECETVRDNLTREIQGGGSDHITIGARFRDRGFTGGKVDEFTVFDRQISELEVRELITPGTIDRALASEAPEAPDAELVWEHHTLTSSPETEEARTALHAVRKALADYKEGIQEIMVMRELPDPKPAYILERGSYQTHGKPVGTGIPLALSLTESPVTGTRRELADWLVNHPLASRVAVNHFWQTIYGDGLVLTPEDFGSQGDPPTHPDLLEWLARDFVKNGWDVKRLIRQFVTSATYRQDSTIVPEVHRLDPENRLLSRAHRHRLPAEMIRDQALAASGLLVRKTGGPPVKPPELAESFKPSKPDAGEGRYRRSIYTYWRRTGPAPVMMALDAAKRDVCSAKRERTSTPLQALVLMNDPLMLTCARELAANALRSSHGSDDSPVDALPGLFRTLTGQRPDSTELAILTRLFHSQRATFRADPEAAAKVLSSDGTAAPADFPTHDLAAMTLVANTILNFDACVMKR